MLHTRPRKPFLVSNDARDCSLAVIEAGELPDFIETTREELDASNQHLFHLIEHGGTVIYESELDIHADKKAAQTMQAAYKLGAQLAYMTFSFEDNDVPFITPESIQHVQLYHEGLGHDFEDIWEQYLLGDENLLKVVNAPELCSDQHSHDVIRRMHIGAGSISSLLNERLTLLN